MTIDNVAQKLIANYRANPRVMPLYQIMAHALDALTAIKRPHHPFEKWGTDNPWTNRWESVLEQCAKHLPSGSGFDVAVQYDEMKTNRSRLVFIGSYHVMREGMYVRWLDYTVTVRPDFLHGRSICVTGGTNEFKDYVAQCFGASLGLPHDMNAMLLWEVERESLAAPEAA
jgi:hypothetical protein